jgi:GTP pyrophosphokinase
MSTSDTPPTLPPRPRAVGINSPAPPDHNGTSTASIEFSSKSEITIDQLLARLPSDSRDIVESAYRLAHRLHDGQLRRTGEAYITHPLVVASYLADLNMDGPSIAAGLLHDVLEDTDLTRDELALQFPEPVPSIVQGVTKISRINFQTTHEAQVENLRLMILAMAQDIRVVIVKLCDRLHNMKTLKAMPEEKRLKISQETMDIYAPLANRLGMSQIKSELEDLAMRWLFPAEYQALTRHIATRRAEREALVEQSLVYLREYLGRNFKNLVISGRPKHFYSIYKKMKEDALSFDQIYDLNALRIICDSESQCYEIMGMIHSVWHPVPGRIKDYIGMPKKNMYQSIHTTVIGYKGVRTEIQIRTRAMHQVAEFGIAAHWKYKEQDSPVKMEERLTWLRQLTEWITDVNEPQGLLEALKRDVFADRVMCFTPKGRVLELPAKATPIDFAYAIHSDIGQECVGAKVNGRMVNLRTELQNGDVVEIMTSKTGHPSRDWLDYAVTGRARQKIKHWLKEKNTAQWIETGRRMILEVLRERHIEISTQELDNALAGIVDDYKLHTIGDLLMEIGFGAVSATAAIARMNPEWTRRPIARKTVRKAPAPTPVDPQRRKQRSQVTVEALGDMPTRTAACCNPIPGDPIVAYVTRGRGLSIHKEHCSSIIRALRDPAEAERIHSASWNNTTDVNHAVLISVLASDRTGLLNDVSSTFSRYNIFIEGSHTRSDRKRGTATLLFDVVVHNVEELNTVLTAIRSLEGVLVAERKRRSELK